MAKRKTRECGPMLMQGNEACARAALAAGCSFMAGYPITPATEIPEYLSREMFKSGGVFMQLEDELASINAVIGASWGGARAMTATSGPGYTLMQEGISYAVETETPLVVINVMRGGPSTGQPTCSAQDAVMQVRYGAHGDYELIALTPSSVQEAFDFTLRAFDLADRFRVPVIVLSDEVVGHTREKIRIPEEVEVFDGGYQGVTKDFYRPDADGVPPRLEFFTGNKVIVDGQLHNEQGLRAGTEADICTALIQRLSHKLLDHMDEIASADTYDTEDADVVLVAYGSVSRTALAAVRKAREAGIRAGLLKLNVIWPVPEQLIRETCRNARHVLVPEMNTGEYLREIQRVTGADKTSGFSSIGGRYPTPDEILTVIREVVRS